MKQNKTKLFDSQNFDPETVSEVNHIQKVCTRKPPSKSKKEGKMNTL